MVAPIIEVPAQLSTLVTEFESELLAIADWWATYSVDHENGGFFGEVGVDNTPVAGADKSVVLNTRILWFFSELSGHIHKPEYRALAVRAYDYITQYFTDREQGGVFWALNAKGEPVDTKKQVYAQAFAIYALVAYYRLTGEPEALAQALRCFELLEGRTVDREKGGYLEAFTRNWEPMGDVRLSEKDLNFPKTMNTHLHVLEAYTTLYAVEHTPAVRDALAYVINCFDQHIINKEDHHLRMFMDHEWRDYSPGFTYGHDVECSWLMLKALASLDEPAVTQVLEPSILKVADVCLEEAMGEHGEMLDGYDFASSSANSERIWWVQAEALIGFLKIYSHTGEQRFLAAAQSQWDFIKKYQIDGRNGEWLWLSSLDQHSGPAHYKLGFWKCPYHNGRAMLEAGKVLKNIVR